MRAIRVEIDKYTVEGYFLESDTDIIDVPSNMSPEDVEEWLQGQYDESEFEYRFNF